MRVSALVGVLNLLLLLALSLGPRGLDFVQSVAFRVETAAHSLVAVSRKSKSSRRAIERNIKLRLNAPCTGSITLEAEGLHPISFYTRACCFKLEEASYRQTILLLRNQVFVVPTVPLIGLFRISSVVANERAQIVRTRGLGLADPIGCISTS